MKKDKLEMLFYCESNNHQGIVVFDVYQLDDLKLIWKIVVDSAFIWDENRKASLIEVNNLKYAPYKGPREGEWYILDRPFWEMFTLNLEKVPLQTNDPHVLFRIALTYNCNQDLDFLQYKVLKKELFIDGK